MAELYKDNPVALYLRGMNMLFAGLEGEGVDGHRALERLGDDELGRATRYGPLGETIVGLRRTSSSLTDHPIVLASRDSNNQSLQVARLGRTCHGTSRIVG